ncbi:MAG: AraC family transcriptional regulator [Lentisphaeria bacterium]|nr:AraC family transcriptional regulator [Lentisphaeria bacterium]
MGKIKVISRPNPSRLPEFRLPLHVRSAGANESMHDWGEYYPPADKPFVQIFWTEEGAGEIMLGSRKMIVHEGDFFYHLPGDEHRHRTVGKVWNYRWFTMDGPLADPFMRSYGYEQEAQHAGICPVTLFLELENLLKSRTPYAQRHALSVATEILALAGRPEPSPQADPVQYFFRKAEERLADPDFTAESIASELGIHRTTFTRQFKAATDGMTPRRWLMELRYKKAVRLLTETNLQLKEIAQECGLSNSAYLCRVIRQRTGMTPEKFRKPDVKEK